MPLRGGADRGASAPEWVASCDCSICRWTGALAAYYWPDEVRVDGETMT
jgi:hypothetical protein